MRENLIEIIDLKKCFEGKVIFEKLNLHLKEHENISILGPSGCGKSTLINIIGGLLKPDSGTAKINSQSIGYVFQEDRLIPWKNVFQNISFVQKEEDSLKVDKVLKLVGLNEFSGYFPFKLSGGMKQRVNLARALVVEPEILLLDEPFANLDLLIKSKILKEIYSISKKLPFSSIMVTHNIREALIFSERVVVLSKIPAKILGEFHIELEENSRELSNPVLFEMEMKILELQKTSYL